MATAPAKSPLHNFPLTFLRWGSNSRCRRPANGVSSADQPETDTPGRRSRPSRNRLASCSSSAKEAGGDGEPEAAEDAAAAAAAAAEQKPWNLRPRKALFSKSKNGGGGESSVPQGGGSTAAAAGGGGGGGEAKSARLRGLVEASSSQYQQPSPSLEKTTAMEAEKKRKFWIALSREEIEEDVFIMTGSRPARRPRKRPKNVQKQLDAVFPGLWLVGISADAYRVAEAQPKASLHLWGAE